MVQFSWLLLPLVFPLVVAIPTVLVIVRNFENPRLSPVPPLVLIVAVTLWCLSDAARLAVTGLDAKLALYPGYYLMGTVVVVSLFVFAADYTERTAWRQPKRLALVTLPVVLSTTLEVTNFGSWTIQSARVVTRDGVAVADVTWGPLFYIHHGIAYLFVAGAAYLFLTFETTNRHYRGQVRSIVAALSIPWLLNVAYLARLTTFNYTSIGFAAALPIGVLMVFRYRILQLIPVERSAVVEEMDTGYLVLDRGGVVVDVNDRAAELLGIEPERLLGRDRAFLEATSPQIATAFDDSEGFNTITRETDGERRYYNVETSTLGPTIDGPGSDTGSVVLFQDVTDQIEAQRQLREQKDRLEEQNERLEEFASILSHDLRNPLSVADGRLELARDEYDSVHMEKIAEAHDRMDELIEDALALARQGQTVLNREPVSLRRVAERAWENVDTGAAALDVRTARTVSADDSQLTQLFENLFRNAVEHGSTGHRTSSDDAVEHGSTSPDSQARQDAVEHGESSVTVTVGDTPDGFYVADDGPGIPPEKRGQVFDKGFSTAEDGTGFGLAIVQNAAEAHGWSVSIAESESGGARFEIDGVRPDAPEMEPSTAGDDPALDR